MECKFDIAWAGKCSNPSAQDSDMCEEHKNLKCASCGAPATRECPETSQFVCGTYLCSNCRHDISGPGEGFNMRHVTRDEYDKKAKMRFPTMILG